MKAQTKIHIGFNDKSDVELKAIARDEEFGSLNTAEQERFEAFIDEIVDADYSEATEDQMADASMNASQAPCEGMTWLELFAASLDAIINE